MTASEPALPNRIPAAAVAVVRRVVSVAALDSSVTVDGVASVPTVKRQNSEQQTTQPKH